jgi:predicted RNase H-like HicB family nuclease
MVELGSPNGPQPGDTMATREIDLSVRVYREDGQWTALAEALDVASCGDTVEEALDNVHDAVVVYLNTLEAEGERERVLAERGIRFLPDALPAGDLEAGVLRTALRVPIKAAG